MWALIGAAFAIVVAFAAQGGLPLVWWMLVVAIVLASLPVFVKIGGV